ncbi:hypothetical protein BDW66DRAFT_128638 [Aspergillus desertorum]
MNPYISNSSDIHMSKYRARGPCRYRPRPASTSTISYDGEALRPPPPDCSLQAA